jgi:hypothetical protein
MRINIKRHIKVFALLITIMVWSCDPDDPSGPTLQDEAFAALAGNWSLGTTGSIVLDGQDVSLNFPGFSLSFADDTYQTSNGGSLFNATGTWKWVNQNAQQLALDTGEEVTIIVLTEGIFEFSFFRNGSTAAGMQGNYLVQVEK